MHPLAWKSSFFASLLLTSLAATGCVTAVSGFANDGGGLPTDGAASDDGSGSSDGAAKDGAKPPGDAGVDAAPEPSSRITCGSTFCRTDQQCTSGVCVTACQGSSVPGDYATVASALSALGSLGADATICLSGQAYNESVSATFATGKALTIIGPASSRITGLNITGGYSKVTLKGLAIGTLSMNGAAPVDVIGARLDTAQINAGQSGAVLVDGCSLGAQGQNYGLYMSRSSSSQAFNLTVQNSWIHNASSYGIYLYLYSAGSQATVTLANDTITANATGRYTYVSGSTLALTYVNDLIAQNTGTGVNLTGVASPTHSNNVLFGNTTNYAGTAVDGTGYVKIDPMLDTDVPPAPKVGSPARGAADVGKASAKDFWGTPRGASADIGAVEGS